MSKPSATIALAFFFFLAAAPTTSFAMMAGEAWAANLPDGDTKKQSMAAAFSELSMQDPVAVALKFGFLAVLFLFLLWVARSSLRDLSEHEDASMAMAADPGAAGGDA